MPRRANDHRGWGRRRFLQGLGLAGAVTALRPFVPALDSAHAESLFPKRLIILNTPNGISNISDWRPSGSERDFSLSPILQPLERHRSGLVVVDGVDNAAVFDSAHHGHYGPPTFWTGIEFGSEASNYDELKNIDHRGWAKGPSVDQIIARRIGGDTAFQSVQLGVHVTNSHQLHARPFWAGENDWLPPMTDPRQVFDRMFGDFDPDAAVDERRIAERRSVLNGLTGELSALRRRLGASDRQRIDSHLEGLSALERRLGASLGTACASPDRPPSLSVNASSAYPEVTQLQIQLIGSMLACDLTRVVTLQWGREGGQGTASWLDHPEGIHRVSHDTSSTGRRRMRDLNVWQAQQFADLLDTLASFPEGDGTLLDNSLVVWGSQISTSYAHSNRNCPVVVYDGAAQRHFDTGTNGRWLRFGSFTGDYDSFADFRRDRGCRPMNDLLVSMCHAMGCDDVTQVGHERYGSGPLPGLA